MSWGSGRRRAWKPGAQPPRGLWFLWTGYDGGLRVRHRFTTLPLCPARLHHVREGYRQWCGLFDGRPGNHSFHVRDPLQDLLHERTQREARRRTSGDDPSGGEEDRDDP